MTVALITTMLFAYPANAVVSTNKTVNFQGRLMTSGGAVVPDGYYNMQFKIYEGGSGTAVNNPGGTLKWTESYVNNNANSGIRVKNGSFSVELGSSTTFGSSVNWDADTLWLSMNIAGNAAACTTFGTAPCTADGEMLPMKRITATPYSINSGAVGGKTADELVQLGQGAQTDASSGSSIHINKTGTGNLMQLQGSGVDVFSILNSGDLLFGSNSNHTLSVATANSGAGKNLTISAGGGATDSNGGNVVISGGAGNGTGADGLVLLGPAAMSTMYNEPNCYTGGNAVAASCTVAVASVNTSSAIMVGFSAGGQTATIPDPTTKQQGRTLYIMSSGTTQDFMLRINQGEAAEQNLKMKPNTTMMLMWNGTNWASPNGGSGNLQDAYNASLQGTNAAEITTSSNGSGGGGLTIKDSSTTPVSGYVFDVQGANNNSLFSVNSNVNELISNPGAEVAGGSASTFPANTWTPNNTATISRNTTTVATGKASIQVNSTGAYDGVENHLTTALTANTSYNLSFNIRYESGTFTDLGTYYSPDGTESNFINCGEEENGTTVIAGQWQRITCTFTTPASGITNSNKIGIDQAIANTRTLYIDNVSLTKAGNDTAPSTTSDVTPNVQIGGGGRTGGATTLFTLDRSASRPTGTNHEAMYGSMYYDETLGIIQCYEAEGWGQCGASPDNFVSLSPEYPNAIVRSNGIGTMTTDICSDMLNINDGSSSQPTICSTNETYNFYKWTSTEASAQIKHIYVTYKLPATFKSFVPESMSLKGRLVGSNGSVSYQTYKDKGNGTGLTACGGNNMVTNAASAKWIEGLATGANDPANCGFGPGDSIVIRVNFNTWNSSSVYASNINFTYSNN